MLFNASIHDSNFSFHTEATLFYCDISLNILYCIKYCVYNRKENIIDTKKQYKMVNLLLYKVWTSLHSFVFDIADLKQTETNFVSIQNLPYYILQNLLKIFFKC